MRLVISFINENNVLTFSSITWILVYIWASTITSVIVPRKIGHYALSHAVIEIESASAITQLPMDTIVGRYLIESAPGIESRGLNNPVTQAARVNP